MDSVVTWRESCIPVITYFTAETVPDECIWLLCHPNMSPSVFEGVLFLTAGKSSGSSFTDSDSVLPPRNPDSFCWWMAFIN